MKNNDMWIYAKVIRKAMEDGPYKSFDDFDNAINNIFDNQNLMGLFVKEIDDWKRQ